MRQTFTKTILILVLSLSFVGFFGLKAQALTVASQGGVPSACPDKAPENILNCSAFINPIIVVAPKGTIVDSDITNHTAVDYGYLIPGESVTLGWSKVGVNVNSYEVYYGCGDSIALSNNSNFVRGTYGTSINWIVPSDVSNYQYCKIWVFAKSGDPLTHSPTLGVSNTRPFTTKGVLSVQPSVALNANPSTLTVGNPTNLNWTVTNATSCTATSTDGVWSGSINPVNGSQSYIILSNPKTYNFILTCNNGSLTNSATASVVVNPIAQLCSPYTTGACTTSEGCGGTKTCNSSGTIWGSCIDNPNDGCPVIQTCTPGTTNYCTTSENCGGTKTCNSYGTGWNTCIDNPNDGCPVVQICTPGATNYCTTSENCGGTKTCNTSGSAWSTCIDTPNDNCPNTTQVPVVTLNATTPITAGSATNLSWYTSNYPTTCTASSTNSTWTGSKNISSGNESVTLANTGNYT
ncbi:MAG: hypothetical protein NTX26_03640 [Candidatus Parcubacteria bacterium]|nr:hypothetical protein [Candidatus Parcubacteria bacterium]